MPALPNSNSTFRKLSRVRASSRSLWLSPFSKNDCSLTESSISLGIVAWERRNLLSSFDAGTLYPSRSLRLLCAALEGARSATQGLGGGQLPITLDCEGREPNQLVCWQTKQHTRFRTRSCSTSPNCF